MVLLDALTNWYDNSLGSGSGSGGSSAPTDPAWGANTDIDSMTVDADDPFVNQVGLEDDAENKLFFDTTGFDTTNQYAAAIQFPIDIPGHVSTQFFGIGSAPGINVGPGQPEIDLDTGLSTVWNSLFSLRYFVRLSLMAVFFIFFTLKVRKLVWSTLIGGNPDG